ncbi:ATP-binding protein [Roseovarius salis]|uniref:ATP-binding protein n=1 Tax=Roseovarius salis TaxID=3376063 RepID=UPI0037CA6B55
MTRHGRCAGSGARFETEVIATPDAIRAVLSAMCRRLSAGGAGPALLSRAELVLAEVMNNIAEHAYDGSAPGRVRLCASIAQDELRVIVYDSGRPMPSGAMPAGTLPESSGRAETLPEGGFGWFLIREQTESLSYRHEHGQNRLELRFRQRGAEREAET